VTEKYGVKRGAVRLFLHYQPSYYHLHVHIVSLANEGFAGAEVGKAHLLDDVISLVGPIDSLRLLITDCLI
jgi:m7GpppX diphosphatase